MSGSKRMPIDRIEYNIIRTCSYEDMCTSLNKYHDRVIKSAEEQISEEALRVATHNLLGDADAVHILDEDEVITRLVKVRGISRRLAEECLKALESEEAGMEGIENA